MLHPLAQKLRTAVLLASLAVSWAACSKASATKRGDGLETLELRYEAFTGRVFPAELAEDLGYLAPIKLKFVGNTFSGPASIQNVVTGDVDFGGAFNGAVIKLAAARAPIEAVISYYGTDGKRVADFYALEGSPIRGPRDLLGKKVAVNTLGAHLEFSIREYLARAGVTPEEAKSVTMVVLPPVNTEQALRQGQVDVAALDDVLREKALERGGIRKLFSDIDLFGPFNAGSYVFSKKFIAEHPNAVRKMVQATAKAIEWSKSTPREEVIARMEKIVRERGRNEDTSALKYWKSYGVVSKNGAMGDQEFQRWIDWLVKDGELAPGQLKPGDLYSNAFQAQSGG